MSKENEKLHFGLFGWVFLMFLSYCCTYTLYSDYQEGMLLTPPEGIPASADTVYYSHPENDVWEDFETL